jgi:hypothetical protein
MDGVPPFLIYLIAEADGVPILDHTPVRMPPLHLLLQQQW